MALLSKILIFPIKSLDGVEVTQATILASGALNGDREFAIVDQEGNLVNGKRTAKIHRLRSTFDLAARTVTLGIEGSTEAERFDLEDDRTPLESWLSNYFGFPVTLIQNTEIGFPDDTDSPGPTVVSTASLQAVSDWFPHLDLQQTRSRFRTNLEVSQVTPFWEDHLFNESGSVPFWVGDVAFNGVNPCQRCIVPVRHPTTGELYPRFQREFTQKRRETLPENVARSHFNHFFRLAVNTRLAASQAGKAVQLGDEIRLPF